MKFEYHVLHSMKGTLKDLEKEITKLGNEGWELVSVVTLGSSYVLFFKRAVK